MASFAQRKTAMMISTEPKGIKRDLFRRPCILTRKAPIPGNRVRERREGVRFTPMLGRAGNTWSTGLRLSTRKLNLVAIPNKCIPRFRPLRSRWLSHNANTSAELRILSPQALNIILMRRDSRSGLAVVARRRLGANGN